MVKSVYNKQIRVHKLGFILCSFLYSNKVKLLNYLNVLLNWVIMTLRKRLKGLTMWQEISFKTRWIFLIGWTKRGNERKKVILWNEYLKVTAVLFLFPRLLEGFSLLYQLYCFLFILIVITHYQHYASFNSSKPPKFTSINVAFLDSNLKTFFAPPFSILFPVHSLLSSSFFPIPFLII